VFLWYARIVLVAIRTPADNQRGPRYMEKVFAAIHQAGAGHEAIQLEYGHHSGEVGLFLQFPDDLRRLILEPFAAKYPACRFAQITGSRAAGSPSSLWYADLHLSPELHPILRHAQFEDLLTGSYEDPIDAILKAVQPGEGIACRISIALRPASRRRCSAARRAVKKLDGPFFRRHFQLAAFYARRITRPWVWMLAWPLDLLARSGESRFGQTDTTGSRQHDREDDVQAAGDKIGGHLFQAHIRFIVSCEDELVARDRLRTLAGAFGSVTKSRLATFRMSRIRRGVPPEVRGRGFLLSAEELATLFHPPTAGVDADRLAATAFRELPPPVTIYASGEGEGECGVGRVLFRDEDRLVGIGREERLRHVHVLGRTGVGKSTLLLNQIRADIERGAGLCVIDPHGDLADAVVRSVPRHRTNDVILFDPADEHFSVGFNPLACLSPERRDLVADDVLAAFEKVYDLGNTPRLKDTLRNALYVLVEKRMTLVHLLLMLSDAAYRERITADIEDDVVRLFWQHEFRSWNDRYRTEALSAIQNKLRPFLMSRKMRCIVGQHGNTLQLRQVMDEGSVLVVPLSKGKLGEINVRLLGSLLVTAVQQAAMSRADIAEERRRDFYLYVDELHNFTTPSFASMLSEIRKYRVGVVGSHQFLEQLDEDTAAALAGNVGSRIVFQAGAEDAEKLAKLLSKYPGQVAPQDLMNLPKYTAVAQILDDGIPSNPFTIRTLAPAEIIEDRLEPVRRASARRYARPAAVAAAMIRREFGGSGDNPADKDDERMAACARQEHTKAATVSAAPWAFSVLHRDSGESGGRGMVAKRAQGSKRSVRS